MKFARFIFVMIVGAGPAFMFGCDEWDDQLTPASLLDAAVDGGTDAQSAGDGGVIDAGTDGGSHDAGAPESGTGEAGAGDTDASSDVSPVDVDASDASADI